WDEHAHPIILIVEDSDEDFYAFLRAVNNLDFIEQLPYRFVRFQDGDEALEYLLRQGNYINLRSPLPAALLLDLNLPGTDGRDIIKQVKHNPTLQILPTVVLTTSSSPRDVQICYQYGVNCYMLKPMGVAAMQRTISVLFQYWFQYAVLPSYGQFAV
ncbi:MAG TPA: response regulator, partial [Chroococcidiopsis sp.]